MHRQRAESTRERSQHRDVTSTLLAVGLAAALVTSSCTPDGTSVDGSGPRPTRSIPQPVVEGLPVAPESERIDVAMPTFSDPTSITNPFFPMLAQKSVLQLGRVDGKAFRAEVTLLPETRIIEWEGRPLETLVSQYVAYLGGRLPEVAYDFYAQADDGSVWYFGEDVFNFKHGAITDTHGTWIAGQDGPAAMIMPGSPKVGDVYRPENIPGLVFEEVTVTSVDQTFDGPAGPIEGGIATEELHMDGTRESKTFAPGYGEFYISTGGDVEATVLVVPTEAVSEPPPAEVVTIQEGASDVFRSARSNDWNAAVATVEAISAAWKAHRATEMHAMLESQMSRALEALAGAVASRDRGRAQQAALDVGQSSLDLQLPYRPVADIDLARFDLWLVRLGIDAEAADPAAVIGDYFVLDYIRDRIRQALDAADLATVNAQLEELLGPVGEENFAAAADAAGRLRGTLAGVGVT